jgi:hypothetical protein
MTLKNIKMGVCVAPSGNDSGVSRLHYEDY